MRVQLCLMVLLPIVLGVNLQERLLVSAQQDADEGLRLLRFSSWNELVFEMIELVGSDEVEHACVSTACPKFLELIPFGNLLSDIVKSPFCQYACYRAQTLIDRD